MKLTHAQKWFFAALGVLAAALLAAAAFGDLAIDTALYAPQNPFGIIFEIYSHSYELTYSSGAYEET